MLKKSTVQDMKVTTDCGPVMMLLLFVCFMLKWCFCLRSYITNLFPFKVQVSRGLLYLHIQVHPTWKNRDVFPFIWSFELIFITLCITRSHIQHHFSTECRDLKIWRYCLFFWKMIFLCSHFEKAKKILNQLSNSPLLKFFRNDPPNKLNVTVKVTPHAIGNY